MAKAAGFQNRASAKDGPDDYPTPPWATRAFLHHVVQERMTDKVVWEPAANRGFMVRALAERFGQVIASDFMDYGAGFPVVDFLTGPSPVDFGQRVDWIITNPPFNKAEAFVERALAVATEGVAFILRSSWMEGKGRYERLFSHRPPSVVAQHTERVPMVQGRLDQKAVTQMPYAWFVWRQGGQVLTELRWVPPSRKQFEKETDYV